MYCGDPIDSDIIVFIIELVCIYPIIFPYWQKHSTEPGETKTIDLFYQYIILKIVVNKPFCVGNNTTTSFR